MKTMHKEEETISENRWNLADKLIDIYDDETFVNYVDSACETEEDIEMVNHFIDIYNPGHEEILSFVVSMRRALGRINYTDKEE